MEGGGGGEEGWGGRGWGFGGAGGGGEPIESVGVGGEETVEDGDVARKSGGFEGGGGWGEGFVEFMGLGGFLGDGGVVLSGPEQGAGFASAFELEGG